MNLKKYTFEKYVFIYFFLSKLALHNQAHREEWYPNKNNSKKNESTKIWLRKILDIFFSK